MTIHLLAYLAFVSVGGMAVGDAGAKAPAVQLPRPATAADSRLERAAREYRIQTYETFHKDRAEYDRRQAEGAHVQEAWTEAGRNEEEQPKLIDWLAKATACSRTDSIADLPAAPEFTPAPQTKEAEKKLVETTIGDSVRDAASKVDDLLHVKLTGSDTTAAAAAPDTVPNAVSPNAAPNSSPNSSPTAAALPAKGDAAPQSKPSTIGSLPKAFGAEISRSLQGLSSKPAPIAPDQGH